MVRAHSRHVAHSAVRGSCRPAPRFSGANRTRMVFPKAVPKPNSPGQSTLRTSAVATCLQNGRRRRHPSCRSCTGLSGLSSLSTPMVSLECCSSRPCASWYRWGPRCLYGEAAIKPTALMYQFCEAAVLEGRCNDLKVEVQNPAGQWCWRAHPPLWALRAAGTESGQAKLRKPTPRSLIVASQVWSRRLPMLSDLTS